MPGWNVNTKDLEDDEEEEEDEEKPSENDLPPPPKLTSVKRRASRELVRQTRVGLDPSVLQVFPPQIIDSLGWLQQDWLVIRLQTYSDRQACFHLGIHFKTLKKWLTSHEAFRKAYDAVVLDALNFGGMMNRLIMMKAGLETIRLLDHPSTKVRIQMLKLVSQTQTKMAEVESRKQVTVGQINQFNGLPPAEWMRKVLESGYIDDPIDRTLDGAFSGIDAETIPRLSAASGEYGEVYEDSGRDETDSGDLETLALAAGPSLSLEDREIFDCSEGEATGS